MHLTYAEAKARVNPDPMWFPKAFSPEHLEILQLMTASGWVNPADKVKAQINDPPPPVQHVVRSNKDIYNPLNKVKADLPKQKPISKNDFLAIKSNRDAYNKVLNKK
jgi:hypothetical protein